VSQAFALPRAHRAARDRMSCLSPLRRHVFVTLHGCRMPFKPNFLLRGKERQFLHGVDRNSNAAPPPGRGHTMKVGDLSNDELQKAIRNRLTSGEMDVLMREA